MTTYKNILKHLQKHLRRRDLVYYKDITFKTILQTSLNSI